MIAPQLGQPPQEFTISQMTGKRLQRLMTLDELAQEMAAILEDVVDYEYVAILLVDPIQQTLSPFLIKSYQQGIQVPHEGHTTPIKSISASVIESKKSLCIGKLDITVSNLQGRAALESVLCVPIMFGHDVIGVIELNSIHRNHFNDQHQMILEIIADQFVIALHNARLLEALQKKQRHIEKLSQKIISSHEEERHRISHQLNDEAGQALTVLRIQLDLIQAELPQTNATLHSRFNKIIELLESTMDQVRTIARNLHAPSLDTVDIDDFLTDFCESFSREFGVVIEHHIANVPDASPLTRISLYRILQEGMTNAIRHGRATRIEFRLENSITKNLLFSLVDNGSGFDPAILQSNYVGVGLSSIQERVTLLRGTFALTSSIGTGTSLVVSLPTESTLS